MAHMHPPELPIAVLADPARRNDAAIFKLLATALDAEFHVFYRCSVANSASEPQKIPDFVILHPRHGLLGVAIADDSLPHSGTEARPLPYSPIRSALRTLIFGLKEQGIRFYIPAPCCVLFPHSQRAHYAAATPEMEYQPLFADDFAALQERITAMMPIAAGFSSTWRVPDAVERISCLLRVNTPIVEKSPVQPTVATGTSHQAVAQPSTIKPIATEPARIVYVVRAIDILLAFATIMAFIMLISFLPDGALFRALDYMRSWSTPPR